MSRILVVDDNEHNRYIASFLLEDAGHEVKLVDNGADAVSLAIQGGFDLILMDIHMPGMDGMQASKKIKAAGVTAPIIALTAKAMMGDREEILAGDCDGYISKPFKIDTFIGMVSQYLAE